MTQPPRDIIQHLDIRGLSIRQPFALALAVGVKDVENRPRPLGIREGGQWVLIHASSAFYFSKRQWRGEWMRIHHLWPNLPEDIDDFVFGAILGLAFVSREVRFEDLTKPSPWACGPVCLEITEARPFSKPIPASGALGLWRPTERRLQPWAREELDQQFATLLHHDEVNA